MGAINYGSNEVVNLGVNLNCFSDLEEFDLQNQIEWLYDDIAELIDSYSFDHIEVKVESGYYEGFYLDITGVEYNYFNDYIEKQEFIKELSKLRKLLTECINYGLVVYHPGWCTGYDDIKESYKAVNKAIKAAKAEARQTPTYSKWEGIPAF